MDGCPEDSQQNFLRGRLGLQLDPGVRGRLPTHQPQPQGSASRGAVGVFLVWLGCGGAGSPAGTPLCHLGALEWPSEGTGMAGERPGPAVGWAGGPRELRLLLLGFVEGDAVGLGGPEQRLSRRMLLEEILLGRVTQQPGPSLGGCSTGRAIRDSPTPTPVRPALLTPAKAHPVALALHSLLSQRVRGPSGSPDGQHHTTFWPSCLLGLQWCWATSPQPASFLNLVPAFVFLRLFVLAEMPPESVSCRLSSVPRQLQGSSPAARRLL